MDKDFVSQVITPIIVSAGVTGLLVWLTKTWISERLKNAIKNEYDQKLETHKAELKARSDVEIEKLRSQLNIAAAEREIQFSRLQEKRAEVIAKTYALLKELFFRLSDYVKPIEFTGDAPKEQRSIAAAKAHKEFRDYYTTRLIFFPKATAGKLEEIDLQLVKVAQEFFFGVEAMRGSDTTGKWMGIVNRVQGEIKTALGELEDEFRRLLGDKS
jgi:hypothetical protein